MTATMGKGTPFEVQLDKKGNPFAACRRYIAIDTETTGLSPREGDRVVEVAAVEVLPGDFGYKGTRAWQSYINPEGRESHHDALRLHGLTGKFLSKAPAFEEICQDFLAFIDEAALVMHNAEFDVGFLNEELKRCGADYRLEDRHHIVCTLELSRLLHPGKKSKSLRAMQEHYELEPPIGLVRGLGRHSATYDAKVCALLYLAMLDNPKIDDEEKFGWHPHHYLARTRRGRGRRAAIILSLVMLGVVVLVVVAALSGG